VEAMLREWNAKTINEKGKFKGPCMFFLSCEGGFSKVVVSLSQQTQKDHPFK